MPASLEDLQKQVNILERLIRQLILARQKKSGKKSRQALLYEQARLHIGRDASPMDIVSDDLGCAESVTNIIAKVIDFPIIVGTATLYERLSKDTRFTRVNEHAGPGTIVVSPTGSGNGKIRGHTGILGPDKSIMSNDSVLAIWRQNYTIDSWTARYKGIGNLPITYFRLD